MSKSKDTKKPNAGKREYKKPETIPSEVHSKGQLIKSIFESKITSFVFFGLFLYVFIVNAWVCDDAYITFRTADNFVNGFGLTWNTFERVQSYTNPLWLFIFIIFYFFTNEAFFTSLVLSLILVFSSVFVLYIKLAKNRLQANIAILFLCLSKAFIDYSSSGLENALTFFILSLFLYFWFTQKHKYSNERRLMLVSFIAAMSAVNRLDTILFYLPVLFYELWLGRSFKSVLQIIKGFIPLFVWLLFALLYYGFPFPNTGYAKLNIDISSMALIMQGFSYFENSLRFDPLTLLVIFSGLAFSLYFSIKHKEKEKYLPILVGVFIYLIYIAKIGGDFMSGRFFSAPFLVIVAVLASLDYSKFLLGYRKYVLFSIIGLFVLIGFVSPKTPILSGSEYGKIKERDTDPTNKYKTIPFIDKYGICDERAFYYESCGLLPAILNGYGKPTYYLINKAAISRHSGIKTFVIGVIGYYGFYCGPEIRIIDIMALTDPLLARLPVKDSENWRIGHFERKLPKGYFETVNTGINQLEDPGIREYYEKLKVLTQSSIFDLSRLEEIWNFNTGQYDDLIPEEYESYSIIPFFAMADTSTVIKVYLYNASVSYNNNDMENVAHYSRKVLELDTANYNVIFNLTLMFLKNRQSDSASKYADMLIRSNKLTDNLYNLYFDASSHMFNNEEYDDAALLMKKLIEIKPTDVVPYKNLYIYYSKINLNQTLAAQYAEKIKKLGGSLPDLSKWDKKK